MTILDPEGNVVFALSNRGFERNSLGTTCTWEADGLTFIGTILITPPANG